MRPDYYTILRLGDAAREKTLAITFPGERVIDIGGGPGRHSLYFAEHGYKVTYNDFFIPKIEHENLEIVKGNFMEIDFFGYDIAFISHVLEHQQNINRFLRKVSKTVKENGLIAIIVPTKKDQIVSGHFTLWNAGLVLYNLVMAEIDCSVSAVLQEGYNISVIVRNRKFKLPEDLKYDYGDLERLKDHFPRELEWNGDSFEGQLTELNWF